MSSLAQASQSVQPTNRIADTAGISHEAGQVRLASLSEVQKRFDSLALVALREDPEPVLGAIVALTEECEKMAKAIAPNDDPNADAVESDAAEREPAAAEAKPPEVVSVFLVPKKTFRHAYDATSYEDAQDYAKRWNEKEQEEATGMIAIVPGERPQPSPHDAEQAAYALALTMATRGMVRVMYDADLELEGEVGSKGHAFECTVSLDGSSDCDRSQSFRFFVSDNDGALGEQIVCHLKDYAYQIQSYRDDSTDELEQVDKRFDRLSEND